MKILIIDDDESILELLRLTFEFGWSEVELLEAKTGEQSLRIVEINSPDAIILDLGLPDMSGFQVIKLIRLFSKIPILVLSVQSSEQDKVKALTWGANDYLEKPFHQMELLARMKVLTRNVKRTNHDVSIRSGDWHFGRSVTELFRGSVFFDLTPVEGFIMHTLIKNAGQFIDTQRLIMEAWGGSSRTTPDTLRVHIHHIRSKIGDEHSNPKILINRPGRGYAFIDSDSPANF
ncbi:response regulator transcription factor [Dehalogenimonas etheniformans]|uniref:DNA-binding response regulator n=1 Tax=Dehalogenimonas etheniformans TaxID=1536648 RepID=A0A2P5PA95_9CHLR|nr:response regulator transcription factor [Dehalogenimonas etheniformans]PPD59195.1 DNA-binding response regulator [Dehalogenimonas etheniformans]QNT75762.1 response regulator transcription factor [Dehalogenimonas etheniformans]